VKLIGRGNLRDFLLVLGACWLIPFGVTLPFFLSDPLLAVVFATIACALLLGLALALQLWDRIRKRLRGKK
jgi:hypothetical protein